MGGFFSKPKAPKAPAKSVAQVKAEKRQEAEIVKLEKKETAVKESMKRRRRGRSSLISGDERGIRSTLG